MKDKTGRPSNIPIDQRNFHDLDGLMMFIPQGAIVSANFAPGVLGSSDGTEVGRYGIHKYGRCVYGKAPKGIYGYDTYGNCVYV